jgi:hypothetical protein
VRCSNQLSYIAILNFLLAELDGWGLEFEARHIAEIKTNISVIHLKIWLGC